VSSTIQTARDVADRRPSHADTHVTAVNIDGRWSLKSSKLTRLREDIVTPVFSIYVSDWIRNSVARLAGRVTGRSRA
jgi:hypothetical protein